MAKVKAKKQTKRVSKPRSKSLWDQSSSLLVLGGVLVVVVFVVMIAGFASYGKAAHHSMNNEHKTHETVVSIQNNSFTTPVTIKRGTKVTWVNSDTIEHTVVADDNSFDLGAIAPNQAKSYVFEKAGTFTYHSGVGSMEGTVVVE